MRKENRVNSGVQNPTLLYKYEMLINLASDILWLVLSALFKYFVATANHSRSDSAAATHSDRNNNYPAPFEETARQLRDMFKLLHFNNFKQKRKHRL